MRMRDDLVAWCRDHLGTEPAGELFTHEHLSTVTGLRLADGREVVVKVRPHEARLAGCAAAHRHLYAAGFACPEPLTAPLPCGDLVASAEALIAEGSADPGDDADLFAALFADLVRLAPDPAALPSLAPSPPWVGWDHGHPGLWPPADDRPDDLNAVETSWLDTAGRLVRQHLPALTAGWKPVVGHGDFWTGNVRWTGTTPLAVHDWDSVITAPEPVLAGFAAAVWPIGLIRCGRMITSATIEQTGAFLHAYQRARGVVWTGAETRAAWLAGVWVLAFDAKKSELAGYESVTEHNIAERLRLGGC
jgi:hypothetical protein